MPTPAENLLTIRDNYINALVTDSASPQPSYSWEGVAVSRTEWRQQTLQHVTQVNKLMTYVNPQTYKTQFM
jgi:hypothetical protein